MNSCPFCHLPSDRIVRERNSCFVVRDIFPVTPGHSLIIPKRHVASYRDLSEDEWQVVLALAREESAELIKNDPSIEGFNLGINDGAVAGQTIFHVHVHLIPRRIGDVIKPRGGVRGVIPGKADYS
jgi:ATP adenylyltransferase